MTGASLGFSLAILVMMLFLGFTYQIACETQWYTVKQKLAFKGLTTLMAAILALYAYWTSGQAFALVMAIGLALCAFADVLLELNFLAGMAFFAAGHLAYILSFWLRKPPGPLSLAVFLCLSLLSTLVARWAKGKVGFDLKPYWAYALIIGAMVSLAAAQSWPVFLGAALFAASDAIIGRRLVFPDKDPWDRACIALYYTAQFLLAFTLLLE